METPKEYYYTYYSYEEWGRGYFGSRGCKCLPEEDVKYLGSSKDKTFKPTQKIILKDDYATREEAYVDEIILQNYYRVVENPHFANRSYQTSTKFYVPKEQAVENGKKTHELGVGIYGISKEEVIKNAKNGGQKSYELGVGIHGISKQEKIEIGRKFGGISGKRTYELGIGVHGRSKQKMSEDGKKGGSISGKQKWKCIETGFITNAGNLTKYQRARGIDTNNRVRIQ